MDRSAAPLRVAREHFDDFFAALKKRGYRVVGPTVRETAIVYADVERADDLPIGWTEAQEAGTYRLQRRDDDALFGYSVGPHSWKQFLLEPRVKLMTMRRSGSGFHVEAPDMEAPPLAIIGARSCDLHAIAIQDRVLRDGPYVDEHYAARRRGLFAIAVQCGQAGGTCFCVSMQTGPRATAGFDLALTEVLAPEHVFHVEIGSEAGDELMRDVRHDAAPSPLREEAAGIVEETARHMGRQMDTQGIQELLYGNREHPRWDDVAKRCLACTNCTLVCPTCFCTSVEDVTDLTGDVAERVRRWDSCYTIDFSHLHGGSVRTSHRARYRQWLTHKLASWFDQFDSSGCVGCGRCITWCPVGIDLTEEVRAIRESSSDGGRPEAGPISHESEGATRP